MTTGMIRPDCDAVRALKFFTKSMMLTPAWPSAGPTGGAGVAAPAGICSLICPTTFLAIASTPFQDGHTGPPLQFLDLREIQLDRRLPAEDRHHHLEGVAVEVHLVHHAREIVERAVGDAHRLRLLEHVLRLRLLLRRDHLLEDVVDLILRERGRLLAGAHEARHLRRVLHHVPRRVRHLHLDQDVAGEELALRLLLLPPLVLDPRLPRDADLAEGLPHAERVRALAQGLLHPLLEPGVGVDDVPLPARVAGAHRIRHPNTFRAPSTMP